MHPISKPRRIVSLLVLMMLLASLACNMPVGAAPTEPSTQSPVLPTEPAASVTPISTTVVEAPTVTPPPTLSLEPTAGFTAPNAPAPNVTYEGISFYRDNEMAASWAVEVVPADVPETGMPEAWLVPSHYQFELQGYPLVGTFHAPQINVFPVRNFEDYNSAGMQEIARLQQFLKDRPADVSGGIPFLPIFNAAQLMRTQIVYLNFQNGSGVRFLTEYSQATMPINNHEMFYTFQGITLDGQYYVSMIMPASHPSLPDDGSEVPGGDLDAFANNFPTYIQEIERQLGEASPSSFKPSLEMLDTLVQSLMIQ